MEKKEDEIKSSNAPQTDVGAKAATSKEEFLKEPTSSSTIDLSKDEAERKGKNDEQDQANAEKKEDKTVAPSSKASKDPAPKDPAPKLPVSEVPGSSHDMDEGDEDEQAEKVEEHGPADMYGRDRYPGKGNNTQVFERISITEMPQVQAIRKKTQRSWDKWMRKTRERHGAQPKKVEEPKKIDWHLDIQRHDSDEEEDGESPDKEDQGWDMMEEEILADEAKAEKAKAEKAEADQAKDLEAKASGAESKKKKSVTIMAPQDQDDSDKEEKKTDEEGEEDDEKAPLSLGAVMKVQNWMRASRKVSNKTFAQSDAHYRLLVSMGNKFLLDTPLPMKMLMYKELLPILHDTVIEYRKQLGKKHPMTIQAEQKVQAIQSWGQTIVDL